MYTEDVSYMRGAQVANQYSSDGTNGRWTRSKISIIPRTFTYDEIVESMLLHFSYTSGVFHLRVVQIS